MLACYCKLRHPVFRYYESYLWTNSYQFPNRFALTLWRRFVYVPSATCTRSSLYLPTSHYCPYFKPVTTCRALRLYILVMSVVAWSVCKGKHRVTFTLQYCKFERILRSRLPSRAHHLPQFPSALGTGDYATAVLPHRRHCSHQGLYHLRRVVPFACPITVPFLAASALFVNYTRH